MTKPRRIRTNHLNRTRPIVPAWAVTESPHCKVRDVDRKVRMQTFKMTTAGAIARCLTCPQSVPHDPGDTGKHGIPPRDSAAHAADATSEESPISLARYRTPLRETGVIVGCAPASSPGARDRAVATAACDAAGSGNAPTWMPQVPRRAAGAVTGRSTGAGETRAVAARYPELVELAVRLAPPGPSLHRSDPVLAVTAASSVLPECGDV
jgi:hypothetical protein